MKHVHTMTRLPDRAIDFTTGQKLTLAAGITDALASFFTLKEAASGGSGET